MASAACIKRLGVPVLFRVAVTFWAIIALLPTPLSTSLPLQLNIVSTAFSKSLLIYFDKLAIDSASNLIVRKAVFNIISFIRCKNTIELFNIKRLARLNLFNEQIVNKCL